MKFLDPKPRTFAVMYTPNVADPTGEYPLWEYSAAEARKAPEGRLQQYQPWGGWKAKLVVWMIRTLLPEPEYLYKERT